jgi:uncharacterized YceG family protein
MTPLFGGKDEPQTAAQRSAAEREEARLERERRRAEREAASARPPAPAYDPFDAPAEDPEPPFAVPEQEEEQPAWEPAPEQEEEQPAWEPAPEQEQQEPAWEPAPEQEQQEPAWEPAPEQEHEEPAWEPAPEPVTVPDDPPTEDTPTALRRASTPSVRDLPAVAGPRPAPVKRRGVPRARRGARRIFALLALVVLAAVAYFAFRIFQPFADDGDAARPVAVTIPPGSTAGQIADILVERDVIDSSFFFGLRARITGQRDDLKAGRFTLRHDMSYAAALDALTRAPAPPPVVKLTIPEGRSIREAAPLVREARLRGSYVVPASRNPRDVTGLRRYGVPRGTASLEGFLFPATYELKPGATARSLVAQQLAAFHRAFDGLDRRAAHRRNLTDYDVMIIASMIEREAGVAKDRRLISAVIANRLKRGMPLGIDATLRYRLNNWSRPLRQSELQTDSAFNTRLHTGLPPTPIGSPGLASIKAALDPAKVDYLFYVVKPCGNGAHAFSSSDAQFQKDVAAYNRKRDQLGGKDPSRC